MRLFESSRKTALPIGRKPPFEDCCHRLVLIIGRRTKHYAELLVWGEIDRKSIIREFSLHELCLLSEANADVADLLQLKLFQANRKTSAVATQLCATNTMLNATTAEAIAVVCKKFGLIKPDKIQALVASFINGWSITFPASGDINLVGRAFAMALNSSTHSVEEVGQSFVEGFHQGTRVLQFWDQRRQPRARKTRTT